MELQFECITTEKDEGTSAGTLEVLKQSSVVGKAVKLPHNAPTFPGRAPITAL